MGIIGWSFFPVSVYQAISQAFPALEICKADDLLNEMRIIKSECELDMLRRAFAIAEIAVQKVIEAIKPGMTELQVVGLAQQAIYENGAEYEGMPQYVLSGRKTTYAISRPTYKVIEKGELVQLNLSVRVGGYSSGVGRPVYMGKMPAEVKDLVSFGLEAHIKTME